MQQCHKRRQGWRLCKRIVNAHDRRAPVPISVDGLRMAAEGGTGSHSHTMSSGPSWTLWHPTNPRGEGCIRCGRLCFIMPVLLRKDLMQNGAWVESDAAHSNLVVTCNSGREPAVQKTHGGGGGLALQKQRDDGARAAAPEDCECVARDASARGGRHHAQQQSRSGGGHGSRRGRWWRGGHGRHSRDGGISRGRSGSRGCGGGGGSGRGRAFCRRGGGEGCFRRSRRGGGWGRYAGEGEQRPADGKLRDGRLHVRWVAERANRAKKNGSWGRRYSGRDGREGGGEVKERRSADCWKPFDLV